MWEVDRDLLARLGDVVTCGDWEEVERRGMSREEEGGLPMSEYEFDFRRLRGKKPRVRRGRRAISTAETNPSICTHESCFHGGSGDEPSGPVTEMDGEEGVLGRDVSRLCN